MKIIAVLVLYKSKLDVVDNLKSYSDYVDDIIVVDNSEIPDINLHSILKREYQNVTIISNNCNQGIAKALNIGFEIASTKKAEWVLTMDQDSSFQDNTFFDFVKNNLDDSIAIYTPEHNISDKNNIEKNSEKKIVDELVVMTSGNLVRISDWLELGGFNNQLFIDEVDHEFCLRLNMKGKRVVRVLNCILNHSLGNIKRSVTGRRFHFHPPLRYYYIYRNHYFMAKNFEYSFPVYIKNRNRFMRKNLKYIILYGPNKFASLKYALLGYLDFKSCKLGKYHINK